MKRRTFVRMLAASAPAMASLDVAAQPRSRASLDAGAIQGRFEVIQLLVAQDAGAGHAGADRRRDDA